jgi:ADP-heptose:LPS heptosyltransferase
MVVDLQNPRRSAAITAKIKAPVYKFKKHSIKKFLLVNFKINLLKNEPQIPQRYAHSIPGVVLDNKGLDLFTSNQPNLLLSGKKVVGFTPGAKHFTKRWPEHYFIELGNMLVDEGFLIVLFGGRDDMDTCRTIASGINGAVNLAADNDILQTAADMSMCIAIVCNDSGLMHAASAVGVPLFPLFGSTVKEFGFTPYQTKNLIFEHKSLSCRPCSHIGRKSCPRGHFKCMLDLTPDLAFIEIKSFINS